MRSLKKLVVCIAVLFATAGQVQGGILFHFTESGGSVLMQSSGTFNTANLVSVPTSGWGNSGVETNTAPQSDIMGDTTMGAVNTAFGFNAGTDLSPWVGDMFTTSNFNWSSTGTTQFATYYFSGGLRTPGIAIAADDLSGNIWTPDVSWSKSGTFASLGLTEGLYTITDAVTSESISIQIGNQVATVPEPTTFAMFSIGACIAGFGGLRRRREA